MSFRCRQKCNMAFGISVYEPEEIELPSGEIQTVMVDMTEKTMPDPELFDLKNQLEAGIDIEEVNSNVLKAKSIDANKVIRKYTKKVKNEESND